MGRGRVSGHFLSCWSPTAVTAAGRQDPARVGTVRVPASSGQAPSLFPQLWPQTGQRVTPSVRPVAVQSQTTSFPSGAWEAPRSPRRPARFGAAWVSTAAPQPPAPAGGGDQPGSSAHPRRPASSSRPFEARASGQLLGAVKHRLIPRHKDSIRRLGLLPYEQPPPDADRRRMRQSGQEHPIRRLVPRLDGNTRIAKSQLDRWITDAMPSSLLRLTL